MNKPNIDGAYSSGAVQRTFIQGPYTSGAIQPAMLDGIPETCITKDGRAPKQKKVDAAKVTTPTISEDPSPKINTNGNGKSVVNRKEIELPKPGISVNDFAKKLAKMLPYGSLYLHGGDIVEVNETGAIPLTVMQPVRFRTWPEKYLITGSTKKKGENVYEFNKASISESDSKAVLAGDALRDTLPVIERVVDYALPVKVGDSVIMPTIGYNEHIKTYMRPGGPAIDDTMSLEKARGVVDVVLGGFPFKTDDDGQSRTHAIARLLTPYFRGVIGFGERVPFWHLRANRPRAGKDYLAQLAHLIYTGEKYEDAALPDASKKSFDVSDETRKRLTSLFMDGRAFVHFANCAGHIDDKFFIQAITAPVWTDRILGKTQTRSFKNEIDFSLSGNMDTSFKADIEPRSRHIILEYFEEFENDRTFPIPDLHGWVLKNRGLILSAIHAFYREWEMAGCPAGKTPFTSFHKWASVIGGVMSVAGCGDPCLPHKDAIRSEDPEASAMAALFRHCHDIDVNNGEVGNWWSLQELYDEIETGATSKNEDKWIEEFEWFKDRYFDGDSVNRRSTGKLLRRWKGRQLHGTKMQLDERDKNSRRHKVRFIRT